VFQCEGTISSRKESYQLSANNILKHKTLDLRLNDLSCDAIIRSKKTIQIMEVELWFVKRRRKENRIGDLRFSEQ
jgi:hypothetical protein